MSSWDFPSASPHGRPRQAAARSPGSLVSPVRSRQRAAGPPHPRPPGPLPFFPSTARQRARRPSSSSTRTAAPRGPAAARGLRPPMLRDRRSLGGVPGGRTGRAHGWFRGAAPAPLCSSPAAAISSSPALCPARLRAACWRVAVEGCAHTCVPRCGRAAAYLLLLLLLPPLLLLLQAAAGAQGLAERLEPAVGRGAPGCALHSIAERRGSLWGRQGGGGLGGSKEERGGETGSAVPAEVEKGRAPHLSRNIG